MENKVIKLSQNLSNYLVSITILCYISGFSITNLYLGSLGVVNLDILRSRYILTGILFIVFTGAIIYLLYGLRKTIIENEGKSFVVLLREGIGFSLTNILIIYVAVPVIAIFAGSANKVSPILPDANPEISWNQWLTSEPIKYFPTTVYVFFTIIVFIMLFFLLIIFIAIILNPKDKDGVRTSRREKLKTLINALNNDVDYKKVLMYLALAFLGLYAAILLSSIIELLRPGDVTSNITTSSFFQVGWSRFFIGIVIVYAFIAVLLLLMSSTTRQSKNKKGGDNEKESREGIVSKYFSWIYVFIPTITTIISVYAFGVYPYLPQQIGGGRLIPVDVIISSDSTNSEFTVQTNKIYLIDRAPSNSLFLIIDQPTDKYKIIEISNELVESIVFYESP